MIKFFNKMEDVEKASIFIMILSFIVILCAAIFSGIQHPMEGIFILECIDILKHDLMRIFIYGKTPLTYFFSVISFKLFGISIFTARLPLLFFSSLTIISAYFISKEVFDKKSAFFSLIICSFNYFLFFYYKTFISDVIMTSFVIPSLLFFIKYLKTNYKKDLLFSLILACFGVFTKQPAIFLIPTYILSIIITEKSKRKKIIFSAVIIFLLIFPIFIWYILNPDHVTYWFAEKAVRSWRFIKKGIANMHWYIRELYNAIYFPIIVHLNLFSLFLPIGLLSIKKKKEFLPIILIFPCFGMFLLFFPFAPYYALPLSVISCIISGEGINKLVKTKKKKTILFIFLIGLICLIWNKIIVWPIYFLYAFILIYLFKKDRTKLTKNYSLYLLIIIFLIPLFLKDIGIVFDNTYEQATDMLIKDGIKKEDYVITNSPPTMSFYLKKWDIKNYNYFKTETNTHNLGINKKDLNQLINKFLEENKSIYFVFERVALNHTDIPYILNRTINLGNITSKHVHPERDLLVYKVIK